MARISRKAALAETEDNLVAVSEKVYNTAVYVRLSVEGEDKEKNRESISTQRYMLEKYIEKQPDMRLAAVFYDNGETGTDFERPGFERMMDEVRHRKIDCIVVKDLSRFGRNYVETGYYLEKIFPYMGVRLVAVNDGYDTLSGDADGMVISLKNLVNDLYAKDISRKISSTFETMRAKGQITSGHPPYGYLRSREDKHRLAVDPETVSVVRDIFKWRLEGDGAVKIARKLNDKGELSPPMFHYLHGSRKDEPSGTGAIWKAYHIRFMLQNPAYAGHTAQGKVRKSLSDGQPLRKNVKEDWIIVKDTHEAIIDQTTFDKVQELVEQRSRNYKSIRGKYETTENILKGLIICADCGEKMVRHKSVSPAGTARYVFQCRTYAENLGGQGCTLKNVGEPELKECIIRTLQAQINLAVELEGMLEKLQKKPEFKERGKALADMQRQVQQKIRRNLSLRASLFESLNNHTLTKAEYLSLKAQYEEEAERLKNRAENLKKEEQRRESFSPQNKWIAVLKKYRTAKETAGTGKLSKDLEISRQMVLELIQVIKVSGYNEVQIVWNFQDEFIRLAKESGRLGGEDHTEADALGRSGEVEV
ncbi:MAG: recombinase family protein [Candidatus Gastranaerophilales bacterium]|nr:recombinase family protein [Candidatus Gastranaerophilales bacterium]